MPKIAFIGAGSVVFAKTLICDILQNPVLAGSTISLMDIDPARLKVAEILARKVVAQLRVPAKVEATLDLRQACRGARYAITMIQVGGYRPATVTDFEIPKKYGLRQTIGDTLGVGGVFRALRTIPELLKVGRALVEVGAAQPLFLNYTNPMAMNMWAIDRAVGVPAVGLCHSVQGTSRQLASYAGLDYADVGYKVAGVNHIAFFLEFTYRGRDAYPLLFRAMNDPGVFARDKVRFEMMRRLGYFVTESSEHFAEYCPYFIQHGREVVDKFGIPLDEYLRRCEAILATWTETERRMLEENRAVSITQSVEYGAQIINAVEGGQAAVVYGNVPNRGLITNLPTGCCVEVPCLVDRQGLQPTMVGDLPPQLAAFIRTNVNVQELVVEAALTRKREHIYHAVMLDPHTSSQLTLDQIWAMCDDLIEAHQRDGFLGDFAPTRPGTGRSAASIDRVVGHFEAEERGGEGDVSDLALVLENQTPTTFRGRMAFQFDAKAFALVKAPVAPVVVAPGKTVRLPIRFKRKSPGAVLRVEARCGHPSFLATAFEQTRRLVVKLGAGEQAETVRVEWSGNTVAEGRMELVESRLILRLRVNDTDVRPVSDHFWEGSALELFFACPGKPGITQIVGLPKAGRSPVIFAQHRKAVGGARLDCRLDKAGYEASLSVRLETVGIKPKTPFLFELQVRVNALGDAHGRVGQAWQGSLQPHVESVRFARIEPVG